MALPRQLKELNFVSGLNTKGDDRAQPEQLLGIAVNVEFDDIGGLRCRFPFDNVRTNILGGGTLTNCRKLVMNGDELLCFTDVALYSWSARDAAWVLKGTHLACKIDETDRSGVNNDQVNCDRAELNGVIVYAWAIGAGASATVQIAAYDKATGSAILPASSIVVAQGRPRLVALQTKILLFFQSNNLPANLSVIAIDPANVAAAVSAAATVVLAGTLATPTTYDVCQLPGADTAVLACVGNVSTIYQVAKVTAALAITTSQKARTCDGPIALSCDPVAANVQIVRGNGTNVQGDMLAASDLHDIFTAQAIGTVPGTPIGHIAAAHRLVTDAGHYRCYVFYSALESATASYRTKANWVDVSGLLGVEADFLRMACPGSRAFAYGGNVFLWMAFGGATSVPSLLSTSQQQNSFFLFRDDGWLVGKCAWQRGGGLPPNAVLPGVQLVSGSTGFAWCATSRRIIPIGTAAVNGTGSKGYAARAPTDVLFTFDANEARRCQRLGKTLYIAGGQIVQYDGQQLVELGFHVYPWNYATVQAAAGPLPNGTYAYKQTLRYTNAQGEIDRSTQATRAQVTIAAGPLGVDLSTIGFYVTRKTNPQITVEWWRTQISPILTSPFYLVTSTDPNAVGDNRYLANNTAVDTLTTVHDSMDDATALTKQPNPENDATLENMAPPAASIIFATDTRLFLAGIPNDPDRVWYSKTRNVGEVAAFHEQNVFNVPRGGGAITAIGLLEGGLIVWRETATYVFSGAGFANDSTGSNYQLSRITSTDLGCVAQEANAPFKDGFLVKTVKGWFVLDGSLTHTYVGEAAYAYDAEPVYAMAVLTKRHQVRILTSGRMLVYDTLVKQWAQSSINDGLDLVVWSGAPAYLTATGVRAELATWDGYAGTDYTLTMFDLETGWIKFGNMQARAIVDLVQLLGEMRSTCVIRKRLAKDYEAVSPGVWSYHTDVTWTPSPGTIGSALQVKQAPKRKRCESIKARFTVTAPDGVSPLAGPCARLTSIAIQYALEPNAYGALGAAQKQ